MGKMEGHGTILGGLPVIGVMTGGYDSYAMEYWTEIVSVHWVKRDGTKGAEIPKHIRDRAEEYDYGLSDLMTQISEQAAFEQSLDKG